MSDDTQVSQDDNPTKTIRVLTDSELYAQMREDIDRILNEYVTQKMEEVNRRVAALEERNEKRFQRIERAQAELTRTLRQMTITLGDVSRQVNATHEEQKINQEAFQETLNRVLSLEQSTNSAFNNFKERDQQYSDSLGVIRQEMVNTAKAAASSEQAARQTRDDANDLRLRMIEAINPIHSYIYGDSNTDSLNTRLQKQQDAARDELAAIRADFKPIIDWVLQVQINLNKAKAFMTSRWGAGLIAVLSGSYLSGTIFGHTLVSLLKILVGGL